MSESAPQAVILAAGMGKRMGGDLPKVLHPVADRPMIEWVVDACLEAGCSRCVVVVGYKAQMVRDALQDYAAAGQVAFVEQTEQLGTAHAAQQAQPLFEDILKSEETCNVFVLAGDGPLIRSQTLQNMLAMHREEQAALTMATSIIDDPTGYGRVVRDLNGHFLKIVEHKDADDDERHIREVNPSYYCFDANALFRVLGDIDNRNKAGEFYLTDAPAMLLSQHQTVCVVDAVPPEDVLSINTPQQLAEVDRILRQRQIQPKANQGA